MSSPKEEIKEEKKVSYLTRKCLKDVFCTVSDIKKVWDENGWNTKNWVEDTIIRKFKKILKEIGLEDETKWYQSESVNGRSEIYIFDDKKVAPEKIYELFDIFYGSRGLIREEEKNVIAKILIDILPTSRSIDDLEKSLQKFHETDIGNLSDEELFNDNIFLLNNSEEHKQRILEAVYSYEPDMMDFFLDKILVEVSSNDIPSKRSRQEFYAFQYDEIRQWRDKWKSIMEYAAAVRIAERFENGYDVCREKVIGKKERKDFYKNGACNNQALQEIDRNSNWIEKEDLCEALIVMQERGLLENPQDERNVTQNIKTSSSNKEEWCNQYMDLVNNICKNELQKVSKGDFNYMKGWALQELKDVGCRVERKRKERIYCFELEDRTAEDLEKLSRIKAVIDSKKRTIFDIKPL